jgi:signal transduction histidine kinase
MEIIMLAPRRALTERLLAHALHFLADECNDPCHRRGVAAPTAAAPAGRGGHRRTHHPRILPPPPLDRHQRSALLQAERQRIMADMHDGVGGRLATLLMQARRGVSDPHLYRETLEASLQDLRLMIDSLDPALDRTWAWPSACCASGWPPGWIAAA